MLRANEKEVIIDVERSDGERFTVGTGTPWRIPKEAIEEWNTLAYSVVTEPQVLTDGSMLISERVEEKDRTFTARYLGSNQAAERARAITFFNPKYSFKVHVTYHGRTRWCEGVQYAFKPSTVNIYEPPEITWTVLCPDPYMRDEDRNNRAFGDAQPAFGWPYVSHLNAKRPQDHPWGVRSGVLTFDGLNTIYNSGDVPTYYQVRIEANGQIVEPSIYKGERFVKLLTTMNDGDILVIDFEQSPPSVTINGQNAINLCSRDSSFTGMKMDVGGNIFSFKCQNEENRLLADVRILFNKRYLGV